MREFCEDKASLVLPSAYSSAGKWCSLSKDLKHGDGFAHTFYSNCESCFDLANVESVDSRILIYKLGAF